MIRYNFSPSDPGDPANKLFDSIKEVGQVLDREYHNINSVSYFLVNKDKLSEVISGII